MIKENYCNFEISKLLQEKGFDETCYACYEYYSSSVTMYSGWSFEYKGEVVNNSKDRIKCPTHQMAMKWLREIHRIDIVIEISDPSANNRKYYCIIWDKKGNSYILDLFDSYEGAVEAAIKYCLENSI